MLKDGRVATRLSAPEGRDVATGLDLADEGAVASIVSSD